jgi:creatinine amidohydrolase
MRIEGCNWIQVERYLESDDRIVVPLGSIEQHGYLSLGVDRILSERVAVEAAEPLGVLVLPALPYGVTPYFAAYPGSPTLRPQTYAALLVDVLDSLAEQGFRRFLFVNGHGGNRAGRNAVEAREGVEVVWHDWWLGPRVRAVVESLGEVATHASWFENFPWTRLPDVASPVGGKPVVDGAAILELEPDEVREQLGDGSFGGPYERPDADVLAVWQAGVEEVRELIESGWSDA